jgi:hypothetical protein
VRAYSARFEVVKKLSSLLRSSSFGGLILRQGSGEQASPAR